MRLPTPHPIFAWLCCLFLQLGCQPVGGPPVLSDFHGCDDVWRAPDRGKDGAVTYVCALAATTVPPISVRAVTAAGVAPAARWSVQGGPSGQTPQVTADGHIVIGFSRSGLPYLLTIAERSPLGGSRGPAVQLQLVEQKLLPVEALAETARQQHTIPQALAALRGAAQTPPYTTDPAARAKLLHALADLEVDAQQDAAALQHFAQALALAEPAGLVLLTANSARRLAFQHFTLRRDIPTALALLEKYDATLRMIDIEAALVSYNRGVYAQERGYLSEAVRWLNAARAAVPAGEDGSRRDIQVMSAVVLAQQGLFPQAEAAVQQLLTELKSPGGTWEGCERMRLCNTLGWTRILAHESHSPAAADPSELFSLALAYQTQDHCAADGRHIYMNAARAELLLAELLTEPPTGAAADRRAQAAGHLQAAQGHLLAGTLPATDQATSMQLDARELGGRIAALQSRWADAETQFAQMAALARRTQEPDYLARALVGLARVYATRARLTTGPAADAYTETARTQFALAEAQLDERLGQVPLTTTRRSFLPRFTAGTAAFLEFLIEHHEPRQALEVARRAQVRGLYATLSLDALTLLPEPQQSRLRQEREEFVRLSEMSGNPAAMGQQLETLLTHLREAGLGPPRLRPLQPGEAMHLCHPLPHGNLACFVADPDHVQVERIDAQVLATADPARQSALLLQPFARLIDRAQVLRVLPSQGLREVNFPALPWPGDSGFLASQQRLVVSALDLDLGTRPAAPPAVRGKALMLINLSLLHAQKSAPWLFARLRQLGWQVTPYSNQRFAHGTNLRRQLLCWLGIEDCPSGLQLPIDPLPGTASLLKRALPEVELAQLDTHATYSKDSGWQSQLVMPDGSVLTIGDLLTLSRTPRSTVLMVCQGGTAGLGADADDISLAQALLLRGGEAVVASPRLLEDALSGNWVQALYGTPQGPTPYLGAATPSLTAAFHAAQTKLRTSGAAPSEWSALRLFVP